MSKMPSDADGKPIPMLALRPGGAQTIAATDTTARNATGFPTNVSGVMVQNDVPVHLKFGDANVSASAADSYLAANSQVILSLGTEKVSGRFTHLAVLRNGDSNGNVFVSELI